MLSNESQRCYFLTFNAAKIDQVRSIYTVAAVLDAILIIPTIVLNILLIISLSRSSEMRKPSTKLLFSLALSDVLVGLAVEPSLLAKKIGELQHDFQKYCINGIFIYVCGGSLGAISFLTLTAIALDRYLVVHTGTKYRIWVTNKRVTGLVVGIWAVTCVIYSAHFYLPRSLYFKLASGVMATCVIIASCCYIKCFVTLNKQKRTMHTLSEGAAKQQMLNVNRYKKSMHTMAIVFLVFNLCYLPFICNSAATIFLGESAAIWGAESITVIAIYSNSFVNPIILFWRMKEIRRAVSATISVVYPSQLDHSQLANEQRQSKEEYNLDKR